MEREAQLPTCFLSEHEGFLGSIKNKTKDFVVTEIDIHGRLVNDTNPSPDFSPLNNEHCQGAEVQDAPETLESSSADVSSEAGQNSVPGLPALEVFDLSVILGQSVHEELERYTCKMKLNPSPSKGGDHPNVELSLGTFQDKFQRANVHRAVRHSFPFLMTMTNQAEIRVKEDPDFRELCSLVSEEEAEDFFRFIDAKAPGSAFTFMPDSSKEHRTAIHHFLSRRFGKLVETKSFTDQYQKTAITVRLRARGKPSKKRAAGVCQEEDAQYAAFTLRKENLETLEAVSFMAAELGVLPSDFTYAGIKDKRAITFQSMVVKKISPERLMEKASEFERKGMQLSSVRHVSQPLHLGRLQGNHFDLVVRDLRPHGNHCQANLEKVVTEAVENVKIRGFVNYYGPQRFGYGQSVQADQVGLALLKEEMVNAVKLFFTPEEEGDDQQNKAKRHFLNTENAKESLALMPLHKARERLMLRALHRYGNGQEGSARAWLSLPHGMRVFYLHAYCSRVWNEAAQVRLSRLAHQAVQGDLVWASPKQEETAEPQKPQIHVVSAEEEKDGAFSLGQVLLPMPGNSVKYPENILGQWYRERLAQDGLHSCRFRVTALKLNVPGCYRPLVARPHNVTYALQTGAKEEGGPASPPSLSLSLDLNPSCYATVCLREVMKTDV